MSLAFREDRRRRVLAPLAPIVLATGWSALILFVVRVPLNPMSVTLGPLVIAVSTEFSVLLSERHRQERLAGHDTIQALRRTYRRTGAAVAALGRHGDRGLRCARPVGYPDAAGLRLVTLIDLTVSLLGVLVALPAALVIAERERSLRVGAGVACARSARPPFAPGGRRRAMSPPEAPGRWPERPAARAAAEHDEPAPHGPSRAPSYGRYVGLLGIVILILITINTIVTKPNGANGIARASRWRRSRRRWRSGP